MLLKIVGIELLELLQIMDYILQQVIIIHLLDLMIMDIIIMLHILIHISVGIYLRILIGL
jgi:hypothetical protein